jgi:hypothetical protein
MGGGSWSGADWGAYTSSRGYSAKSTVSEMYTATKVKDSLSPIGVEYRESCDSDEHPNSTPIIVCLDVTGSMSRVLDTVSKKLNVLASEIYNRNPVSDPQIMFMAFGDVECDRSPLQVSQFESDIRIAEQLNDIYFERGGGGNDGESYTLPWYFASRHTKIDCLEKRGKKGFLFTIGDEPFLNNLSAKDIKKFVGDDVQKDLNATELLNEVSRMYEVYHLMIEEGNGMSGGYGREVIERWTDLLGQRAVLVSDCSKIPEVIVSILEFNAGKDIDHIADSWDGTTAVVVKKAIDGLVTQYQEGGLVEFS